MFLPALKEAILLCTHTRLGPQVSLTAKDKHLDGIHLKKAGCELVAAAVFQFLSRMRLIVPVSVQKRPTGALSPKAKAKTSKAAREIGKTVILEFSRQKLREFADKFGIKGKGQKNKQAEQDQILGQLGLKWRRL